MTSPTALMAAIVLAGLAPVQLHTGSDGVGRNDASALTVAPVAGAGHVVRTGATQRGWLGARVQNLEKDYAEALGLPDASGALVVDVEEDGPAGTAGLAVGDVVLAIDGEAIADARGLAQHIKNGGPGTEAALTINRDGETLPVRVILGSPPRKP